MLRSKKPQQGPATCELLPRSRRIFVCGAWFRFGGVTMCKMHLDKTLHPAPFLSSSARSLSAWGSACGWPVSRTPPLGTPTRLYVPLLPAWHGLAVGELPTVKCLLRIFLPLSICSTYNTRGMILLHWATPQGRTGLWRGLGFQRYYTTCCVGRCTGGSRGIGAGLSPSLLKEPLVAFASSLGFSGPSF